MTKPALSAPDTLRSDHLYQQHGRVRASLRAIIQDLRTVLDDVPPGIVCDRLHHICTRDLRRAKQHLHQ